MRAKRTIILTDIHGCNKSFRAILAQIQPNPEDHFCFLGDYIDRGPDSKGVIDTIFELEAKGHQCTCLIGNHEELLLDAIQEDVISKAIWKENGGRSTLASFDIPTVEHLPDKYVQFFEGLQNYAEIDNAILVHAGLDFQENQNPLEGTEEMRWIRYWYNDIDYGWLGDRIIIHGHTPQTVAETEEQLVTLHQNRYLNLDTGCAHEIKGSGVLTAFDLTNEKLYFQERVEGD